MIEAQPTGEDRENERTTSPVAGTVYIVRHGNTFAADEQPRRIGARSDLPLTPAGRDQAHQLGTFFSTNGIVFAAAWSAPLQRTTETARLILAEQAHPPILAIADWLTEIDHGPDEGRLECDVRRRLGADVLARWETEGVAPADWKVDRRTRIRMWQRFLAGAVGRVSLVVTSNGAGRFALLGAPMRGLPASLKLQTGSYGRLDSRDGVAWSVGEWNRRPA